MSWRGLQTCISDHVWLRHRHRIINRFADSWRSLVSLNEWVSTVIIMKLTERLKRLKHLGSVPPEPPPLLVVPVSEWIVVILFVVPFSITVTKQLYINFSFKRTSQVTSPPLFQRSLKYHAQFEPTEFYFYFFIHVEQLVERFCFTVKESLNRQNFLMSCSSNVSKLWKMYSLLNTLTQWQFNLAKSTWVTCKTFVYLRVLHSRLFPQFGVRRN